LPKTALRPLDISDGLLTYVLRTPEVAERLRRPVCPERDKTFGPCMAR
jgi:hypothetical protein